MTPKYAKEKQKWGLKASKRPKKHENLAGIVNISGLLWLGHAFFSFSEAFVAEIGKIMEYGVGPDRNVYLQLTQCPVDGSWSLFCKYFQKGPFAGGLLLLTYKELPEWVKIRQKQERKMNLRLSLDSQKKINSKTPFSDIVNGLLRP